MKKSSNKMKKVPLLLQILDFNNQFNHYNKFDGYEVKF